MTQLGVFRDDFYNPVNVLTNSQFASTAQGNGTVLAATALAGATECYVSSSGATALTTDTAANVIAQIQTCVLSQMKTQLANGSAGNPPPGVPNLNNLTYLLFVRNTNAATLTLTAGAGVTITGTATVATTVERQYQITVTSPTTITLQDLGGATIS